MTKADLIAALEKQATLTHKQSESLITICFEAMIKSLYSDESIEIRGFGSFSLHYRAPRVGRNPKTGDSVELSGKYVPHFKPGKELRERVNLSVA